MVRYAGIHRRKYVDCGLRGCGVRRSGTDIGHDRSKRKGERKYDSRNGSNGLFRDS